MRRLENKAWTLPWVLARPNVKQGPVGTVTRRSRTKRLVHDLTTQNTLLGQRRKKNSEWALVRSTQAFQAVCPIYLL